MQYVKQPLIMLSDGKKFDGNLKDTCINIEQRPYLRSGTAIGQVKQIHAELTSPTRST